MYFISALSCDSHHTGDDKLFPTRSGLLGWNQKWSSKHVTTSSEWFGIIWQQNSQQNFSANI